LPPLPPSRGPLPARTANTDVWRVNFGDSSVDFEVMVRVVPELIMHPGRTKAELLWALEDELCKRGIEIPFPQRDLQLRSGSIDVNLGDNAGQIAFGRPTPGA